MLLLQNPGFQRFCRFEIQPMCQATFIICDLMSSIRLGNELMFYINLLALQDDGDHVALNLQLAYIIAESVLF